MTSPRSGSRIGTCRISLIFQRRIGGRIALVAEATIYGRKVVTYNLHLESRGTDALRVRQLNEVLADCRTYVDAPEIRGRGRFQSRCGRRRCREGSPRRRLSRRGGIARASNHSTAHVLSHARPIDWIFVSDTPDSQGRVHNEIRASDHYPVSATVTQRCAAA